MNFGDIEKIPNPAKHIRGDDLLEDQASPNQNDK
jgi:hypothetical protein